LRALFVVACDFLFRSTGAEVGVTGLRLCGILELVVDMTLSRRQRTNGVAAYMVRYQGGGDWKVTATYREFTHLEYPYPEHIDVSLILECIVLLLKTLELRLLFIPAIVTR
jgi:hypothetical protein